MRSEVFNNLTVARFAAALLVVFHHAHSVLQDPQQVPQAALRTFFNSGYIGVTFFFILSGFVITASSHDKLSVPSWTGTLTFFARRGARIVPLWLFLSMPFVLPALLARPIPGSVLQFLTFTQAWSSDMTVAFGYLHVAWTLSCEMFFYALFPLAALIVARLQQRSGHIGAILVVLGILLPLCVYLAFFRDAPMPLNFRDADGPNRWLYRNPAARFPEFLLGMGLFLCLQKHRVRIQQAQLRRIWLTALAAAIIVLCALMCSLPISAASLTLVYIPPFALIVFCLAAIEINEKPVAVSAPLLLLLGEASYALYLTHEQYGLPPFLALLGSAAPRFGLLWAVILTVALSIGLYKLVELPARAWLNVRIARLSALLARKPLVSSPGNVTPDVPAADRTNARSA
jgi:peptidoglycan/LPS O-acetylase OafA/YrhL